MVKSKKSKSTKKKTKSNKSSSKKARLAEKAAKKAARKGDGSFPDLLVVTRNKADDKIIFQGYDGSSLAGLNKDGQTVGVYKLRRVSTVTVNRKVAR